jgi:glycosyltransferase involved in cell wall biosynthesis
VHGVTVMSQCVHDIIADRGRWRVNRLWLGGARGLDDINRRSIAKFVAFARLLGTLAGQVLTGVRHDLAYLTLAPWTHAALRDGLLAGAAKALSRRTFVHLHGEGLDRLLASSALRDRVLRRLLAGTELITATSGAAETAKRSHLFAGVVMLPNTVPDPIPPPDLVQKTGAGTGPLRIGYLANLDPRKGALRFIDAIAAVTRAGSSLRAVIAGPATPLLSREALTELVAARGLTPVVEVTGAKYGREKDAFWRNLDVFLYLSSHDHAPLVVIEALSYGVAPIVLDTGGIAEMLGPELAHNVLRRNGEPFEFEQRAAARLRSYIDAPDRLMADRRAARERYLSNFSEREFARRCVAILKGG